MLIFLNAGEFRSDVPPTKRKVDFFLAISKSNKQRDFSHYKHVVLLHNIKTVEADNWYHMLIISLKKYLFTERFLLYVFGDASLQTRADKPVNSRNERL